MPATLANSSTLIVGFVVWSRVNIGGDLRVLGGTIEYGMDHRAYALRLMPFSSTLGHMTSSNAIGASVILEGWDGVPTLRTLTTVDAWNIEIHWQPMNGRIEPFEMRVSLEPVAEPRQLTAEAIRKLPIGAIISASRRRLPAAQRYVQDDPDMAADFADLLGPDVELRKPQRGQQLTDDDLEKVAVVYRSAWVNFEPVNEAVRRAFHLSKDGAAKRIGKARAAGLLDGIGPKR